MKDYQKEQRQWLKKKNFNENEQEKYFRLYKEFDNIGDKDNAETQLLNLLHLTNNTDNWLEYFKFSIKYGMYLKAEECLMKILANDDPSNVHREK